MCVYVCMHACVDVGFGWGMNGGFGWGCEGGLNFRLLSIQILYFFFVLTNFLLLFHLMNTPLMLYIFFIQSLKTFLGEEKLKVRTFPVKLFLEENHIIMT